MAEHSITSADRPEHVAVGQLCRRGPGVDGDFCPSGHWDRAHSAVLADEATMHQRLSRCWTCFIVSAATSDRRTPQATSTAGIARSRRPFLVEALGAFSSFRACWTKSQFATRTLFDLAPLTREMPAASSGDQQPVVGGIDRQLADGGD
jgi:hypothetical protein